MSAFQVHSDFILVRHLSFVGFERISQSLCKGLISAGFKAENILVTDSDNSRLEIAEKELKTKTSSKNSDAADFAQMVFLCVKPAGINSVLKEISDRLTEKHVIVSVAAGIKIKSIEKEVYCRVLRLMPNIAVSLKKGVNAVSFGKGLSEKEKQEFLDFFSGIGVVFEAEEKYFNLITVVSGSGPAFWARLIEYEINAVNSFGLEKEKARKLVLYSIEGTLALLAGMKEKELIDLVASPQGVTAERLKVLEEENIEESFLFSLKKALENAGELSHGK
ncbi:NAD(P)-binding domain-containing protein [Candidatus Micrarchaeota archaeon]|nr:NAD(P)-binding domain-containing protein [Candidatus Micrarchaeota archaeon]